MKPRAFTLIELLIALAVVAILTALILSTVSQARQKARQTNCASNLRQINIALQMYVSDNDSIYPADADAVLDSEGLGHGTVIWIDALKSYLGNDYFYCPNRGLPGLFAKNEWHHFLTGYAYNSRLNRIVTQNQKYASIGRPETALRFPSLTVAIFDARTGIFSTDGPDTDANLLTADVKYSDHFDLIKAQPDGATRHGGGANYAFADGHVRWYRPEQLGVTRKSDGVQPGFGL